MDELTSTPMTRVSRRSHRPRWVTVGGLGGWSGRPGSGTKKTLPAAPDIGAGNIGARVFDAEAVLGGLATLSLDDEPSSGWSQLRPDTQG